MKCDLCRSSMRGGIAFPRYGSDTPWMFCDRCHEKITHDLGNIIAAIKRKHSPSVSFKIERAKHINEQRNSLEKLFKQ